MKRLFNKLVPLVFLLCLSLPALARGKYNGVATKSDSVVTAGTTSKTTVYRTFPGAEIRVYLAGSLTLAAIFSDAAGTIKGNPFNAPADARIEFYADAGLYDIRIAPVGGSPAPFTLGAVSVIDDERLQNAVNVATCATAGAGTIASPWTGWNNHGSCVWAGRSYYFGGRADGTPGVYSTSTAINWSYGPSNNSPTSKPIYIEGNNATINCTGSGTRCITIASATDTNASFLHGIRVQNLKVRNTGTWTEGLYISGNFAGVYESLDIAWFSSKNFHLRGVVQDHFNLINSFPEPKEPVTADPIYIAEDLLSSDNEFLGLNAVGATHASIFVGLCQNSLFTGTGEGNSDADRGGLGLICSTNCRANVFKMDNEGNEVRGTGRDFSVDGHDNVFLGTVSTGLTRITINARDNTFIGGLFNSIQVDAGARNTKFQNAKYNLSGAGTFVDNGTNTTYFICNFGSASSCKINDSTAYRIDGINLQSEHEFWDGASLVAGTKTITIPAGLAFASTAYTCYLTNVTAARPLQFTIISGTQFRVNGTGTDSFNFRCKGH